MADRLETWSAADPTGTATREFRIVRDGKRDVTGALWLPDGSAKAEALVCFGHGASGDRYQAPAPELASGVLAAGIPFLAFDGPDHGLRRTGEGGRKGMVLDLVRPECLDEMREDWNLAIDLVAAEFDLHPQRIAYFGLSMGTAYGLSFVASRPDVVAATLGLWGAIEGMPRIDSMMEAAKRITVPILYLMQADDEFVSNEAYLRLFAEFGTRDKRLHANPGLHAEIPTDEVLVSIEFLLTALSETERAPRAITRIVDA